jgi:hypothetical protein
MGNRRAHAIDTREVERKPVVEIVEFKHSLGRQHLAPVQIVKEEEDKGWISYCTHRISEIWKELGFVPK